MMILKFEEIRSTYDELFINFWIGSDEKPVNKYKFRRDGVYTVYNFSTGKKDYESNWWINDNGQLMYICNHRDEKSLWCPGEENNSAQKGWTNLIIQWLAETGLLEDVERDDISNEHVDLCTD